MKSINIRKWFGNISTAELLTFILAYFISSWLYRTAIWISGGGYEKDDFPLFNLVEWFQNVGLHHLSMMVISSVIWLLLFRILTNLDFKIRILSHIIFLPLFLLTFQRGYYWLCDQFGYWHFDNQGQVWDIYIPMLMYLLQFGIFHAYEYYRLSQKRLKDEMELKNAATQSELAALKAQLNPHFLYNVFNTINASIPKNLESTREMIADLSDLFRYQLKASKNEMVTLKEELEFVNQYLSLEKKRFGERLEVIYEISDNLLEKEVPSMILQPLVENSIKHGISKKVEGGKIKIKVQEKSGKLDFVVADTGVGLSKDQLEVSEGIGLANTQLRLQKLYHTKMNFTSNIPEGLIINFSI